MQEISSDESFAASPITTTSLNDRTIKKQRRSSLVTLQHTIEDAKRKQVELREREEREAALQRRLKGIEVREAALNKSWELLREKKRQQSEHDQHEETLNIKDESSSTAPAQLPLQMEQPASFSSFSSFSSSSTSLSSGRKFLASVMQQHRVTSTATEGSRQQALEANSSMTQEEEERRRLVSQYSTGSHGHHSSSSENSSEIKRDCGNNNNNNNNNGPSSSFNEGTWGALNRMLSPAVAGVNEQHNEQHTTRSKRHGTRERHDEEASDLWWTAKHLRGEKKKERLDSNTRMYRTTWQHALGLDENQHSSEGQQQQQQQQQQKQQPKWKSTNRRNTMIGVDYGIGSGRILSSHLSSAMTTMDSQFPSGEEPPSVMNAIEMLQLSKKRAAQDFSRRKRAYLAARYQHQQKLASSVELQHLEGYNSIYGVNRFK